MQTERKKNDGGLIMRLGLCVLFYIVSAIFKMENLNCYMGNVYEYQVLNSHYNHKKLNYVLKT